MEKGKYSEEKISPNRYAGGSSQTDAHMQRIKMGVSAVAGSFFLLHLLSSVKIDTVGLSMLLLVEFGTYLCTGIPGGPSRFDRRQPDLKKGGGT